MRSDHQAQGGDESNATISQRDQGAGVGAVRADVRVRDRAPRARVGDENPVSTCRSGCSLRVRIRCVCWTSCSLRDALGGSQACADRARGLWRTSSSRPPCMRTAGEGAQANLAAAHTDWSIRATDTHSHFTASRMSVLDYAVFGRVVRDDDDAVPRGARLSMAASRPSDEGADLVVDGDAQGLEDEGRRIVA